jgi:hypothetical protein
MAKPTNQPKETAPTGAVNPALTVAGLSASDQAAIQQMHAVAEAEAKAKTATIPEGKRRFILQEIPTSQFTVVRRRVELTPSMCTVRGCGFDAAKEVGFPGGWKTINQDQPLPDGRKLGEAILGVLNVHRDTAHALETSHIISEDEMLNKTWAGVPAPFLTAKAA